MHHHYHGNDCTPGLTNNCCAQPCGLRGLEKGRPCCGLMSSPGMVCHCGYIATEQVGGCCCCNSMHHTPTLVTTHLCGLNQLGKCLRVIVSILLQLCLLCLNLCLQLLHLLHQAAALLLQQCTPRATSGQPAGQTGSGMTCLRYKLRLSRHTSGHCHTVVLLSSLSFVGPNNCTALMQSILAETDSKTKLCQAPLVC